MVLLSKITLIQSIASLVLAAPVSNTNTTGNALGNSKLGSSPFSFGSVDLDKFSANSTDAFFFGEVSPGSKEVKREDVKACYTAGDRADDCMVSVAAVLNTAASFADLIFKAKGGCKGTNGHVEEIDADGRQVYLKYEAAGESCKTTARRSTIEGAVEKWINKQNDGKICQFQCIELSHGGHWRGYVGFGTNQNAVKYTKCDSSTGGYAYACEKGGVNDRSKRSAIIDLI
ncbi:unnamed protein product [Wickerhamomyces anomalus]